MREIIIVTDTSCLIALSKTETLRLLPQMYHRIIITEEIRDEFGEPLPEWIEIMTAPDKKYQQLLESILDKGEASAIALAVSLENVLLVLDDLKARKEAKRLGFKITGTLGILFSAKQHGLIPALKPYFDLLQLFDFRISTELVKKLLMLSNEIL
jgi:predicted nucleic acid-binding protein